eukprot:SAG22_NODE_20244_length_267_cov_0.619048_1_plen_45_part_10
MRVTVPACKQRGAKFGVLEGGVRSNSFIWGPGVLPDGAAGKVYNG